MEWTFADQQEINQNTDKSKVDGARGYFRDQVTQEISRRNLNNSQVLRINATITVKPYADMAFSTTVIEKIVLEA